MSIQRPNPYLSPATDTFVSRSARSVCRSRLPILVVNALLVFSALILLLLAAHFHRQYGKSHSDASRTGSTNIRTEPTAVPSPESFYKRAEYAAVGVCGVFIAAMVMTVLTKGHPVSVASLIVCLAALAYVMLEVLVRY